MQIWFYVAATSLMVVGACGGDKPTEPTPATAESAATEAPEDEAPAPATKAPEDKGEASDDKGEPTKAGDKVDPNAVAEAGSAKPSADATTTGDAAEAVDTAPDPRAYPPDGSLVRVADPESSEGVIQRVLAAAAEPDEKVGWHQFLALLHTKEKEPNALPSRRSMNFAASRRKVQLFKADESKEGEGFVYKINRIEEKSPRVLKYFVANPQSSPTPCWVERDAEQEDKWRVTMCSL